MTTKQNYEILTYSELYEWEFLSQRGGTPSVARLIEEGAPLFQD